MIKFLSNYDHFFKLIREIKEIKNTNNTFLIKLTAKVIGKVKRDPNLFKREEDICKEIIKYCEETNNISMKNRIMYLTA